MLDPQTRSTSGIEVIDPQDVEKAMRHWGIDPILADSVLSDILRLIQQSNENNHYVAHLFTYHMENCDAGALSHCISTLLVIARPHEVDDEMDQLSTELIHVYIESGADTLEQKDYYECCSGCWFRHCCRICSKPRELTPGELYAVRRVLFSYQSLWVREHMSRIVKMWELDALAWKYTSISSFGRLSTSLFFRGLKLAFYYSSLYPDLSSSRESSSSSPSEILVGWLVRLNITGVEERDVDGGGPIDRTVSGVGWVGSVDDAGSAEVVLGSVEGMRSFSTSLEPNSFPKRLRLGFGFDGTSRSFSSDSWTSGMLSVVSWVSWLSSPSLLP